MRERPLVYLVPPMAAALYAAVCLELPVQLHIIAPIALLLVLAAVFLRRRKCLLNVFAVLAAAALALTGFAVFRDLRVVPIRALAGETQEITAAALRDAEVYDTDQRVLLSAETTDGRRFRLRCYLPETEPPLLAGDRVRVMATLYVPDTLGGFDRAAYQASEGCYIAGAYATDEEHNAVQFEVLDSKRDSLRFAPQRIARFCRNAVQRALPEREAGLVRPLISYLLWSANIIADLGFGTLHPNNTFGLAALGIVFAALLVWLTAGKHVKWKAVLPCLAVVLIGLCIAEVQHQNGQYTVTYLPCGSGQAILLSDTEHAMLIDCGSYRNAARQVREWLRWNGLKRLDTVVLTAVDQGHARNLPELMETVEVGELLMPAGCQERRTNADLLFFVHEREAQEVSEPVTLTNPIAPVELFPITEGKLAVSIADEVLILHSPTEKQLSAYLEQNTLPAAAELVLSANHLSSGESMAQYAEAAGAQHIIIAASSEKGLRSHKGLDVQSTYKEGEIARQFKKE